MMKDILLSPFQKFVKLESLSGFLLFGATLLAMIWANSPYAHAYIALWEYKLGFTAQSFELVKPLVLWVNDGLMAIFFFLIGLEIKRELLVGELNTIKKATFPLLAAIGGMLFPLVVFLIFNSNPAADKGWGIPMATDIAFSLAILKLLGDRVPLSLKIFLTAFAIVDDLGAVLIIAIFYSEGVDWTLLIYAVVPLIFLSILTWRGIYIQALTFILGIVVWVFFLKSGIHPTIAGVLLAFTIPIRRKMDTTSFLATLSKISDKIFEYNKPESKILSEGQLKQIDNLEYLTEEYQSPLQHLEHNLHGIVAYFVMPVFALANAGIVFGGSMKLDYSLIISIIIALVFGKLIGITFMSYLGIKLGLTELPDNVNFKQVIGVSILAGVGFTMSIFVANLAFQRPVFLDSAKVGIMIGSLIAGILGYWILRSSSSAIADNVEGDD